MKELNKAQVAALFELEAILIGTENCVPESRAVVLFGKEAVEYVRKLSPWELLERLYGGWMCC